MIGRKLSTPPTPLKNSPVDHKRVNNAVHMCRRHGMIDQSVTAVIPDSKIPCKKGTDHIERQPNTIPMIPINAGIPVYFPVRN